MSDPYRTSAMVPVPLPSFERRGTLMSKWTMDGVSLHWDHGDESSAVLTVEGGGARGKTTLDVDDLREFAAMIGRAIDEMRCT